MAHYEDIVHEDDRIKCNLCSIYLKDDNNIIQAHVNDESHRDLEVRRTLIQNSVVIIDNNFYCYVCDYIMDKDTIRDHLQSVQHNSGIQEVMEIVKTDGIFLKVPDDVFNHDISINCVLCDRQISFTQSSVKEHINSDIHRRARAIAVQPLNGIFSIEGSDSDLWCKFCRVYFENYIEVIFEHVDDDAEHKKKVAKILNLIKDQNISIEKFLMDPMEDKATCNKCDKEVACNIDNLMTHVKGKFHNK